jgi:hypothetical protein
MIMTGDKNSELENLHAVENHVFTPFIVVTGYKM